MMVLMPFIPFMQHRTHQQQQAVASLAGTLAIARSPASAVWYLDLCCLMQSWCLLMQTLLLLLPPVDWQTVLCVSALCQATARTQRQTYHSSLFTDSCAERDRCQGSLLLHGDGCRGCQGCAAVCLLSNELGVCKHGERIQDLHCCQLCSLQ